LKQLWTFETQAKLDAFCSVLKEQEIDCEITSTTKDKTVNDGLILMVDDQDYKNAKKLLLHHRKRRTSIDKM